MSRDVTVLATDVLFRGGTLSILTVIFALALMVLVVAAVVAITQGVRKIPVQYAKRIVGRRMYGGANTHIPLRVNTAGVIPVIFASSLMALPATLAQMAQVPWLQKIADLLAWGQPLHYMLYVVGIIFFSYFYISIIFNPANLVHRETTSPGGDVEAFVVRVGDGPHLVNLDGPEAG